MGEVASLVEAHREDGVPRVQERFVDRNVGVCAAVGLDVGVIGAKECGETLAG